MRLEVIGGETLVILGGSGSGKSTLLRLMIGNDPSTAATFVASGKELHATDDAASWTTTARSIGVLFQSGALFNSMSVADNVALPLREHTDLPEETIEIMVKIKLELVGLREHADKMPAELSGGMKKRAGLARAIALDPKILFYDEPVAGLDPVDQRRDRSADHRPESQARRDQRRRHARDGQAFRIADRMVLLDRGKFVVSGTPHEMRDSDDPLVRQFVHGLTEGPLTDRRRAGGYEVDLLGGGF